MQKILVPVDFSISSNNAARYAYALADTYNLDITFLHVYYPQAITSEGGAYVTAELEKNEKETFDNWVVALPSFIGDTYQDDKVTTAFEIGFPSQEIIRISNEGNFDAIVMGSSNRGRLFQQLFGSVSEQVSNQAEKPVLVVPKAYQFQKIEHCCFAYAEPKEDVDELKHIISTATQFGCHLDLLHILNGTDKDEELDHFFEVAMQSYKAEKISSFLKTSSSVERGISEHIMERKTDLLYLLKRDRSFFKEIMHKSQTKLARQNSDIPVFIFHEL